VSKVMDSRPETNLPDPGKPREPKPYNQANLKTPDNLKGEWQNKPQ
jgi:hypothetical protein